MRLYQLAARQGDKLAQYNSGQCYFSGNGMLMDKREAVRWYRLSVDQGVSIAHYMLKLRLLDDYGGVMEQISGR